MATVKDSSFIGKESIVKLLLRFSWPAAVATTINMLYNLVDRVFIGNGIGKDALAGLALTMPYMIILGAFGMMCGVGTSAIISLLLGQKRKDEAEKALGQLVFMCLLSVITLQILGLVFLDDTIILFGGNAQTIPYAHQYLRIILWGSIFQHLSFGLSAQLRAEGNAQKCMFVILIGAISNIILDPIFIFVFKMGIAGAAYATILSMLISSSVVLSHFIKGKGVLRLKFRNICWNGRLMFRIMSIGMAPCLLQIANGAINIAANRCFNHYAPTIDDANTCIACWSIALSVNFIFITPILGLAQGMQPIVGFNTGAELWLRVHKAYKTALIWGICFGLCTSIILRIFAPYFIMCFNQEPELVKMGARFIRLLMWTFPFVAIDILTCNYFQAIGRAWLSALLSMLRQVIFFLPLIIILSHFFGTQGIWFSVPSSDSAAIIASSFVAFFELRSLKKRAQSTPQVSTQL